MTYFKYMESKFQDLLKNIIPGCFLLFSIAITSYFTGATSVTNFITDAKSQPVELLVLFLPFMFFLTGYINDIISSQIEYWLYEIIKSPSSLILNNQTDRYRIVNLKELKKILQIDDNVTTIESEEAYKKFQKANQMKINNEEINEFYMSYIFSRNLMISSYIALAYSLAILVIEKNLSGIFCSLFILVLVFLFTHRWKQRAKYYTKKVFLAVMNKSN